MVHGKEELPIILAFYMREIEQTIELLMIWCAMMLMWLHCNEDTMIEEEVCPYVCLM